MLADQIKFHKLNTMKRRARKGDNTRQEESLHLHRMQFAEQVRHDRVFEEYIKQQSYYSERMAEAWTRLAATMDYIADQVPKKGE